MTKRILSAVAVAAVLAFAQLFVTASASEMNIRVPFSFTVNGKALPPGTYAVTTRDSMVLVTGLRGAISLTNSLGSNPTYDLKLVFEKRGDRYDLREVWTGGGGREIVPAKKNREQRAASNVPVERVVVRPM